MLVAEDEQPLREAICDLIASEDGLEVVGEAADAAAAIERAKRTKPDVAVVDVRMPGGGAAAAEGIHEVSPETRIVALSAYEDQATVIEMLRSGAIGYLIKGVSPAEVVEAVKRAARGQASFSSALVLGMTEQLGAIAGQRGEVVEVLRESEQRFRHLLESAPDAVVITDDQGALVLVNHQAEELFGYPGSELLGRNVDTLLPDRFRDRQGRDLMGRRKDGSEFPVEISLSEIPTEQGQLVTAFIRDITDRRETENMTRQLAAIVDSSDDAIIGKTLGGVVRSWNPGAERTFGYTAEEMIGRPVSLLIPHGHLDELPGIVDRLSRGEEIEEIETTRQRKDGTVIDVVLRISAIRNAAGVIIGTSTIGRDVTQLKAQAQLERELAERRALLAHLVTAGEEERGRIAMDIHDDSIQAITAAGMRLQILRRRLEDPEQLELLDDLEQTIQLAISRLRHLLFELRPPVLDNEGLSAALATYLDESEDGTTRYRLDDELREQPAPETRTILYRIVQEALANVRKHSGAGEAVIALREERGGYLVRVSDDGVGFVADDSQPIPGHLGLASMRERAELAGGWLRLETEPGSGTAVVVWIPSPAGENAP